MNELSKVSGGESGYQKQLDVWLKGILFLTNVIICWFVVIE